MEGPVRVPGAAGPRAGSLAGGARLEFPVVRLPGTPGAVHSPRNCTQLPPSETRATVPPLATPDCTPARPRLPSPTPPSVLLRPPFISLRSVNAGVSPSAHQIL